MKKIMVLFLIFCSYNLSAYRSVIIEDFDSGVNLESHENDIDIDGWFLSSDITCNTNSDSSLALFGNTWKILPIEPTFIDSNTVWQVAAYCQNLGSIQGFGISDGTHELKYSFFGYEELNIEEWIPHNQGAFPMQEWHLFNLPIADDWLAWYDELPVITELIFINQLNGDSIYFDDIIDISEDLPKPPEVEISYDIRSVREKTEYREVEIQFEANVFDEDSEEFVFFWQFGDGFSDTLQYPVHTYLVTDEHEYTVFLEVIDESDNHAYAVESVEVDFGETSLPLTMNFVGDIMIGRYLSNQIENNGVDYPFSTTMDYLGNNADITVANLEVQLTTSTHQHPTKTVCFKANPAHAVGLKNAGIDVVSLANNHILDYMEEGLIETRNTLDTLGITYSGAGLNSAEAYLPAFLDKKGINIAFLASSDRTGQYNNYQPYLQAAYDKAGFAYQTPYYIQKQINEVKDVADIIVIESHSGSEYSSGPGSNYDSSVDIIPGQHDEEYSPLIDIPHMWDREIRHFMIDSGADIVICHHPHIVHGFEIYKKKLIAHSLGNFIFDLNYFKTMPTVILNTEIGLNGFEFFEIQPAFINNYVPNIATGDLGYYLLKDLAHKSKLLNTYLDIDYSNVTAEIIIDTLTMQQDYSIISKNFSLTENDTIALSNPIILEKEGYFSGISRIYPGSNWQGRLGRELVWFGNMESEGFSGWNINSSNEWYDNETYFEGTSSICISLPSYAGDNYVTNLNYRIRIDNTKTYSLYGWIKTENASDASIEIRYYPSRTSNMILDTEDIGTRIFGDSDWTFYHAELDVDSDATYFDIRLTNSFSDENNSFAWFDNVGVICWEDWQDQVDMIDIINPNHYTYLQLANESSYPNSIVEYKNNYYHAIPTIATDETELVIKDCNLSSYPNPFYFNTKQKRNFTTITYSIPANIKNPKVEIFNAKGQKVNSLACKKIGDEWQKVIWNGLDKNNKPVSNGVYFYQIQGKNFKSNPNKLLILK